MNEILDGMKVLKLYAWEPSFARKVQNIRSQEVDTLKKMAYLGAAQTFMFTAAPTIGMNFVYAARNQLNFRNFA